MMRYEMLMVLAGLMAFGGVVQGVEEAAFEELQTDGDFALRNYEPQLLAEVVIDAGMQDAGNIAFRPLFRYISGNNKPKQKITMTAPVSQESEKIQMTTPVGQEERDGKWIVSFMMPQHFTRETLPEPLDPAITIRAVPSRTVAAVRYGGGWSEKRYHEHLARLQAWMEKAKLEAAGEPIWARYNGPFTPWFLRRNEILIPVKDVPVQAEEA
jgi:hypothetical protein